MTVIHRPNAPMLTLLLVVLSTMPSIARAELLATFDGSVGDWQGFEGKVESVASPSADARGALKAGVALSGRGWTDITVESPIPERNFASFGELRVSVMAPGDAPPDLKAQMFAKSGPDFTWSDGGWQTLSRGQWTVITVPITRIAHPAAVRTVGVKIGANNRFQGTVFIDKVEAAGSSTTPSQQASITIVGIVPDARIQGSVHGIPTEQLGDYKVLVYVKTDKWYIHPYERGGEGLSFASINRDGSWQIQTVKREFLADSVAALVVRRDYAPLATVQTLEQIESIASYTEEGKGRL